MKILNLFILKIHILIVNLIKKSYLNIELFLDKNYDYLLKESLNEYFDNMSFDEKIEYFLDYLQYYGHIINIRNFNKIELIFMYEIEIFMFIYMIKLTKKDICDDLLKILLLKDNELLFNKKIKNIDKILGNISNIIYENNKSSFIMKFKRIKNDIY